MRRLLRSGHGCETTDASNSGAVGGSIVEPQRRPTKRPMDGVSDEEPASKHFKADGRLSEGSSFSLFITLFITLSTSLVFSFIHTYFKFRSACGLNQSKCIHKIIVHFKVLFIQYFKLVELVVKIM
jgi:hypothetical protein